jgi:hypothetical protein
MSLPRLIPTPESVDIQETAFSLDALGRYVCSSWHEATTNGGKLFDVVVVGGGMYGAFCATKVFRHSDAKRVLLLDAGPFLVPQHVQNLPNVGFAIPSPLNPADDPGSARDLVWGLPWRGNVAFPGLAYCIGGKSIYWGGWCPRLTEADLAKWPASTADYLRTHYEELERETGVAPATDFITGELYVALKAALEKAAAATQNIDHALGTNGVQEAPLAVQGSVPASGLFSFDKYSSAPILIEAVRDDIERSGGNDANRRLFVVPRAHVLGLRTNGSLVDRIVVSVDGEMDALPVTPTAAVVLASSTIETTRLALHSFPRPLMGRNLMAHVRSDFAVRIKRSALPPLPVQVQTAAALVRGVTADGRFHIQVTGSANPGNSDGLLFQMIPDFEVLDAHLANDDPDWITVTLRGIGEIRGDSASEVPNANGSWINLSQYDADEFGVPRAYVQLEIGDVDQQMWSMMDATTIALAQGVAADPANIQYMYDGAWQDQPFPLDRPFPPWHNGLGTTYHEAGTLWMGDDPATSVTDPVGRFHHVENAYACDQSLFPTVGSVNPTLTGLTLARQLAERLALG